MRELSQAMHDIWTGGEFTGPNKPFARVTIQMAQVNLQKVDDTRLFASFMFGQGQTPIELPNVKSVTWERSIGADAATATIVFYNTAPLPLGEQPTTGGDFDLPGVYTYNYGATSWAPTMWGQRASDGQDWTYLLVPDRLLRTYEGYGFTPPPTPPELDTRLAQTGTWLIDEVVYGTDGLITVTCRDAARMLQDHICFPPVIPLAFYPMRWEVHRHVPGDPIIDPKGISFRPVLTDSSNKPYVGSNGAVHGHKPSDAFDDNRPKTYWLSVGNQVPHAGYSYEWIEGSCGGLTVGMVEFTVVGGPYQVYLSVKTNGKWAGTKKIPYDPTNPVSAPNGADITYSSVMSVKKNSTNTFKLTHPVAKIEAIRLTFTKLWNSGIGPFKYRAAVSSVRCYGQATSSAGPLKTVGNYTSYDEIVRYLLASGGFHWPKTAMGFLTYSNGDKPVLKPALDDPFLKSGRVWGDIENIGTGPAITTNADGTQVAHDLDLATFDKKPLMDGIAYIRDILGAVFFVDEGGGAVFRMANIYALGNFVGNLAADSGYVRGTSKILTIDEKTTLIGLQAKLSTTNRKEKTVVSKGTAAVGAKPIGAVAVGYDPLKTGNPKVISPNFRRISIYTDEHYDKIADCQRAADLITIRQALAYRKDTVTVVGYPGIQIDDQIRIYERITNEGYYHYVQGIRSSNDLETGKWTYDLTTNWLGESPFARWAFDPTQLSADTVTFLTALGKL